VKGPGEPRLWRAGRQGLHRWPRPYPRQRAQDLPV